MAGFRMQFRKSFRITKNLRLTVSKRGISLNFKMGPLSKSWGTRENRTTIDAPGTFGFSWQKRRRKSASRPSRSARPQNLPPR